MTKNLDDRTLHEMIENMLTGVAFFSFQENRMELLYMNSGGYRMLGYTPEEGIKYVNRLLSLILEEDKPKFWQAVEDVLKDDGAVDVEFRTVTASGSLRWLQVRGNLYERTNEHAVILLVFLDATERKFVENEIYIQLEWYQVLLETDEEMLFDYNARTDVLSIKRASEYGIENTRIRDRFLGRFKELQDRTDDENRFLSVMEAALKIPRADIIEVELSMQRGREKRWYRIHTSSIAGVDGYVTHIVGKITDIHEKKLLLEELREKEKLDTLTGWYNLEETKEQIGKVLAAADEEKLHAFMLVDMSDFSAVKECFGEEMENQILQKITKRIENGFKRSDILGRISNNEFVVFVQNIGAISNLGAVASRIAKSTEITLGNGADTISLAGSIGVSVYPYQGSDWDGLLLRAEKAVNSLKASGKKGYYIHKLSDIYKKELAEEQRPSGTCVPEEAEENPEELLLQILCENRQNENLLRTMLKVTMRAFGFHRACLSIAGRGRTPEIEFTYFEQGYEKAEAKEEEDHWSERLKRWGLLEEKLTVIHNYDPIPEELSSYMIRNGIRTLLMQPIIMRGNICGVFLLGECTGREWAPKYDEEKKYRRILQLVQIYAIRYEREREGLPVLKNEIRMLDNFDSYVLAIDYDTYELCYANRKILEALPELQLGDCCYRTFARQDRPCDMCIMKSLGRDTVHASFSEERFSTALRSWLKVHASWLKNNADGAICLANCIDISEYFMGSGGIDLSSIE